MEQSAFRALLKSIYTKTVARALWLALGLLVIVGAFSFWNTSTLIETNYTQIQLRMLLNELQEILSTVNDAETGQRGYLLVGEDSYLDPYQTAAKSIDQQFDQAERLLTVVPGQRSTLIAIRQLVAQKFAEMDKTIALRQGKELDAAMRVVRTGHGQQLIDEIRGLADQVKRDIQDRLAHQDLQIVMLSKRATLGGILGSVLAAVLFVSVIQREFRERKRAEEESRKIAHSAEVLLIQTLSDSDKEIEELGQQARELAEFVETSRVQTMLQSEGKIEALGNQAGQLARSVETLRIQAISHADDEVEALGQPPRDMADEIEALGQQARDLARSVESSRIKTLHQSDEKIEALGQQARDLARSVESSRIKTLKQSDKEIEALGQQARDLATFVESSRMQTLKQSDGKIEALGQQARDLASSVESSRLQTLNQSDMKIEALEQQARDLATFVESSRKQTLTLSDGKIEALGLQARELATAVETLRKQTLTQSDGKIEALGQQARDLAAFVESSRIETLNRSNQEIRKLNEGLEQRVSERTAQLEAANKELDSFSYSVSHDLRAPLRAIDGFSRIVLEEYGGPLPAEGKKYLQMVRDNTRQMGQLVDDLLAFARLGRQPLTKHLVESDKIVRRCIAEMAKEQEGRQVEILIGDLPDCNADPNLLKQVWTNLLSNALKYTRKRETTRIEIGCHTASRPAANGKPRALNGDNSGSVDPEVVYFVKDNGTGFDMKYVGKLFGVFQRLHRAAEYEGTGVGLAIVQRIVLRHGGRIWADAKVNEGATFSFTLN